MAHTACRAQTPSEEIANSLSHGLGAVLAAVFSPRLIGQAVEAGTVQGIAAAVYCASMILLFSVSAAYHWVPPSRTKDVEVMLRFCTPTAPWRVAAEVPPGPMPTGSADAWDSGAG